MRVAKTDSEQVDRLLSKVYEDLRDAKSIVSDLLWSPRAPRITTKQREQLTGMLNTLASLSNRTIDAFTNWS